MDAQGAAEHRRALLAGLTGPVLEVGAGNGRNFAHYPSTVTDVLAVEPEPYLRGLAQVAAGQAPVPVRVVDGTADALPTPDASMKAAVAALVLCSVPDQARALAELHQVLRPGGELRFSSTSKPTPLAWPGSSGWPTSSGPWWVAVTPTATPWPPSPLRASRSPASSGSGSPTAGCHTASRAARPWGRPSFNQLPAGGQPAA
jgi:SAM-dependent methyltransferase